MLHSNPHLTGVAPPDAAGLRSPGGSEVPPEIEAALAAVEHQLSALGEALRARDAVAIDTNATELHRALAVAMDRFTRAARTGGVPHVLRQRLALASGQVAAQRESLARATAALDRAMDVLLPENPASGAGAVYSAVGHTERGKGKGFFQV